MNNKIQCPICGNTNNIFLDNNSLKLLKLRHPGLIRNLLKNSTQGAFALNVTLSLNITKLPDILLIALRRLSLVYYPLFGNI